MGSIRLTTLEHGDDTIADVYLVIEILALELEELPVEFGDERQVNPIDHLRIHKRSIHRTNHIVANPFSLLWLHL